MPYLRIGWPRRSNAPPGTTGRVPAPRETDTTVERRLAVEKPAISAPPPARGADLSTLHKMLRQEAPGFSPGRNGARVSAGSPPPSTRLRAVHRTNIEHCG